MSEERNQENEGYRSTKKDIIIVFFYLALWIPFAIYYLCLDTKLLSYDEPNSMLSFFLSMLLIEIFGLLISVVTIGVIVMRKEIKSKSNLSRKEHGIALLYGIIATLLIIQTDFHTSDFHSIWGYYLLGIVIVSFIPLLYTMCCEAIVIYKQQKVEGKGYKLVLTYVLLSILIGLFCVVGDAVDTNNYFYSFYVYVILCPLIYTGSQLLLMLILKKDSIL